MHILEDEGTYMSEQYGGQFGGQGMDPKAQKAAEKAYRKAQRPFYKKKRVIIPGAILGLGLLGSLGGGGGDDTVETDAGGAASEAPAATGASEAPAPPPAAPAEPPKPTYAGATDNDTVAASPTAPLELSGWTTTVTPLARTTSDLQQDVLCTNVTLANNDDEQQEYSSLSWKLQYPNGSVLDTTYGGNNDLSSAGLAPGGTVTQTACFEDTGAGPGQYILSWQPDIFSSEKRGVWLNTL